MIQSPDTTLQQIILNSGTCIVWGNAGLGQPLRLTQKNGQVVVLHFTLGGGGILVVEGLQQTVRVGQHTMLYPAGGALQLESAPDQACQFLQIQMTADLFCRSSGLAQLAAIIRREQAVCLMPENRAISSDMYAVLAQITKCPLTCSLKRLFLEAKVLELLALQLAQHERGTTEPETDVPNPDHDKLMEVRRLLETHFDNPPTLPELSRLVGLNECKLKKGFKAAFDDTIYNWVLNYRLDRAYQLLQRRELSVSEVAYSVGYQHPAHFTTAFKKKFGLVPSQAVAGQLSVNKMQEV